MQRSLTLFSHNSCVCVCVCMFDNILYLSFNGSRQLQQITILSFFSSYYLKQRGISKRLQFEDFRYFTLYNKTKDEIIMRSPIWLQPLVISGSSQLIRKWMLLNSLHTADGYCNVVVRLLWWWRTRIYVQMFTVLVYKQKWN